jgi:hypothetical protein
MDPSKSKESVGTPIFIFDWDDTLLASTFLEHNGYTLFTVISLTVKKALEELEANVYKLLDLALNKGKVYIITNAQSGWVQLSSDKYLPKLKPLLDKIKVISARSTYESEFETDPLWWKYCAFFDSLESTLDNDKINKNIISMGDSFVEREAITLITEDVPKCFCKSIKFSELPSIEELNRQIMLIINCIDYIVECEKNLDLKLTITPKDREDEKEILNEEKKTVNIFEGDFDNFFEEKRDIENKY